MILFNIDAKLVEYTDQPTCDDCKRPIRRNSDVVIRATLHEYPSHGHLEISPKLIWHKKCAEAE